VRADELEGDDGDLSAMRDLTEKLPRARTAAERAARRRRRFEGGATTTSGHHYSGEEPASERPDADETAEEPLTYEALVARRERLERRAAELRGQLLLGASARTATESDDDDDDDEYTAQHRAQLRALVRRELDGIERQAADVARLEAVARPALAGLKREGTSLGLLDQPSAAPTGGPPPQERTGDDVERQRRALAPERRTEAAERRTAVADVVTRLAHDKRPADDDEAAADDADAVFARAKRRHEAEQAEAAAQRRAKKTRRREVRASALGLDAREELQGGDTAWQPPVGQDGTGRTKLNDLLGY